MDEPTNYLDIDSIKWLEEFLINFENTVVVVSHDRHFLNTVCTHIVDIDYGKLTFYAGNYDFWYESSQLLRKQLKDENKKKEERIAELKDFIRRFSSNAAKSKQATSRKKILDKINLEEMRPSSRKFPYIAFTPSRESGKEILSVEKINKVVDGVTLLKDVSFTVQKGEKIAIIGQDSIAKTMLFKILAGEEKADKGDITWGQTINYAYFPKDNAKFFDNVDLSLIDWLKQFSKNTEETYIRSFLGRMLFSGDESLKSAKVLSGGEKVRCMLSRMMLSEANFLMLDEATNHLDLESITALNNGLTAYKESMLFVSQDHQFISTIANRIIEITPKGIIDKSIGYDDYLESEEIRELQKEMYS
jgi:ATPase subunit of ABC transporter with duplicated ATPase domains